MEKKEFVSYEQAVALKELGFDEVCMSRYCVVTEWEKPTGEIRLQNNDCNLSERFLVKAPLKQQVFRWFREKYGLIGWVEGKRVYRWCIESPIPTDGQLNFSPFKTYEEAENACIKKLLELAKQQD